MEKKITKNKKHNYFSTFVVEKLLTKKTKTYIMLKQSEYISSGGGNNEKNIPAK